VIDERLPLLLLPGTLCDASVFTPMLPPGYPTIAADLTRHASVGAAALAVLSEAPPRFIALGFSLGGIVALSMAQQAPERVAAMVLIATTPRPVAPEQHAARRAQVADGADPAVLVGETLWANYVHPDRVADDALRAKVVAMARACPPDTARRQTELALSRVDQRECLGALAMPVLILSGEQDAVAPPATQAELATGLPQPRIARIPGAGHFVLLEKPEACARALGNWLSDLSQGASRAQSRTHIGSWEVS
jgi:pimeloyl-ACP methyl ester carboxylesterase